ncbi:unknown protein [Parachlamydia acanthamoebae UV-7]|uniref:Uncharacterized protein n=1 Tax=Parachlamydia acanthamoebae (strain UV7) TaxID=765952 RepID=F8L2B2_PARAV|nr:unknown protein [Parachlamydia acanthamoebae UV-7]
MHEKNELFFLQIMFILFF